MPVVAGHRLAIADQRTLAQRGTSGRKQTYCWVFGPRIVLASRLFMWKKDRGGDSVIATVPRSRVGSASGVGITEQSIALDCPPA
jgi:hypothetical protein